jgi:hypothetical protein
MPDRDDLPPTTLFHPAVHGWPLVRHHRVAGRREVGLRRIEWVSALPSHAMPVHAVSVAPIGKAFGRTGIQTVRNCLRRPRGFLRHTAGGDALLLRVSSRCVCLQWVDLSQAPWAISPGLPTQCLKVSSYTSAGAKQYKGRHRQRRDKGESQPSTLFTVNFARHVNSFWLVERRVPSPVARKLGVCTTAPPVEPFAMSIAEASRPRAVDKK